MKKDKKSKIKNLKSKINLILLIILIASTSFAQQNKIDSGVKESQISYEIPPEKTLTPQREISAEEKKLSEQLMQAKQSGNADEMMRIQKQLDSYSGSVTKQEPSAGKTELMYGNLPSGQDINITRIFSGGNAKAVMLQREQIGSSNRMWAVIVQSQSISQIDTVYTLFSDDNGIHWTYFSRSHFTNRFILTNHIDAEIVQTATQKYIYIVCGLRSFPNGKFHIGMIVNAIAGTTGSSLFFLDWPGEDQTNTNVMKYRPRIISDCSQHQLSGAWIYVVCSQDSVVSGGYITTEKTARINNPYALSPAVTYKPDQFYWSTFTTSSIESYCDLAYYKDGSSESIMVIESGIPVISYIYMLKSTIQNFTSSGSYSGSVDGGTSRGKTHAYISSNGFYTNLMITDQEQYAPDDFDIQFFKTSNSGLNWSNGYVDFTTARSMKPDIMERKNVSGEFYLAYLDYSTGGSNVRFCKAAGNTWGTVVPRMNHQSANDYVAPGPCFLNSGSDNCFAIWTGSNSLDIWVSSGCSGNIIGISNNEIDLSDYHLLQNYPNPFNPTTTISYNLIKNGFVTLKIYDVLGREVKTLVNEYQQASLKEINFNASGLGGGIYFYKIDSEGFTDTKKMIIAK